MPVASMIELLDAGVHFGHQTQRWNPKMKPYIYGARNGIYVLDLRKTSDKLDEAYNVVRDLAAKGKNVVFYLDKDNIQINGDMINKLVTKYGPKIRFSQGIEPYITLNTNEKDEKKIIEMIKEMLVSIQK